MGLLDSLKHKLIIEACDRVLANKTFKSRASGFGMTTHEYQAKLRNGTIKLSFYSFAGTSSANKIKVQMIAIDATDDEIIYQAQSINDPIQAHGCAEKAWEAITLLDKAKIGNLDQFQYFDYLDYLFDSAYIIRSSELQAGKLCAYDRLDDVIETLQTKWVKKFDRIATKLDLCKLIAEKDILARYCAVVDAKKNDIDDRIYLDARLLIESNFPGVANYKNRKHHI
jgi:hypothetical protein